jgi:hypothetical protein
MEQAFVDSFQRDQWATQDRRKEIRTPLCKETRELIISIVRAEMRRDKPWVVKASDELQAIRNKSKNT